MSSGACRALVVVLLSLVALVAMVLPAAAATDRLNEASSVIYTVNPKSGEISVKMIFTLTNNQQRPYSAGTWGPVVLEEQSVPRVSQGFAEGRYSDVTGLWRQFDVEAPVIDEGGAENFQVNYTLDASIGQDDSRASQVPARVGEGYVYFCMLGQDTDIGLVRVNIAGKERFKLTQTGSVMEPTNKGLKSTDSTSPAQHFTCVEGTIDANLLTQTFIGPAEREIVLQAWPETPNWLPAAEANAAPSLDAIHEFLGHDIPGEGPVIVRQAPPRSLGGYASAHDTPGIVQLDESAGVGAPDHELAHAWFSTDNFTEVWLREGLAEYVATAMTGEVCPPAAAGETPLDLSDWQVVGPTADSATIDQAVIDQQAAACGIVSAVSARMGDDQWQAVLGSLLDGETKYVGSSGPAAAASTRVDYREWLDAVDEVGLVPAAADPAFAANLTELDFAQDLLDGFGIPVDPVELEARSAARARYHQFLADAAPLGAPLSVREAMDNWLFDDAMQDLDKADEVLAALKAADALLPTAGLIPFVQPAFEGARNAAELDEVLTLTEHLSDSATEVAEPLGELQSASPEGWGLPVAIRDAITAQRFDDIKAAIPPALEVVANVAAADAALPTAGFLEKYQAVYEGTLTTIALTELAEVTEDDKADAARVGRALTQLQAEIGDWSIPEAVTAPVDAGDMATATDIVEDAFAVVSSARAADAALPDANLGADIRPRFEGVTTGAEMKALRVEAEAKRTQAEAVGDALSSLSSLVPEWTIPAVVTAPIAERDFETAAGVAEAAQRWVVNAWEADQALPEMGAIDRVRPLFEGAATAEDLETGAALAENWNIAAASVRTAVDHSRQPLDLLSALGMWGTDVGPGVQSAIAAAIAGDVDSAINASASVNQTLSGAGSVGGLRLAGIIFFVVALVGVVGMWIVFRRQSGPSWARSKKPHWIKNERPKLGSGKVGTGKVGSGKKR